MKKAILIAIFVWFFTVFFPGNILAEPVRASTLTLYLCQNGKVLSPTAETGGTYYTDNYSSGFRTWTGTNVLNGDITGTSYTFHIYAASTGTTSFRADLKINGSLVATTAFTATSTSYLPYGGTVTGIDPDLSGTSTVTLEIFHTGGTMGGILWGDFGSDDSYVVLPEYCTSPFITGQPQSQTIGYNTSTTLSVTAAGTAPLHYQWYQGSSGDTSTPVGTDSNSYTTPNLTSSTSYWVRVTNPCGSVNSDTAVITVNPPPTPEMNVKQGSTGIGDGGSYDFGSHGTGTNTDVIFTIENQGTADLILDGSPIITITGADADQFSVQQQPSTPILAGSTSTFIIRFSPLSVGAKTASISIANNDADENPYDITLTGTSFEPGIDIKQGSTDIPDGGSYDFGTHATGNGTNVAFTIENTDTADLYLYGSPIISIIGPDADQFTVLSQPASAVSPATSTFFTIRFFPTSAGLKTAQISIANNDPDENPYDITFNGTGANLVGSLTVTLEPQEARDAGAQWQRLCASSWHDSGYTESSIPAGSETVEFKEIPGWTRPDCKSVTISDGGSAQVTGTYIKVAGGGTFIDSGQAFGNYWGESVELRDLDGDSDLDAFVANDDSLNVLLNDGSANFTYSGQNFGSAQNYQAALGDVDNDGDLDALAVKSSYSHNQLWLNDGSGTFINSGQNLGDSESHGVALGDLDCDGDLDAFIVNANFANPQWSSPNQVWLNDGTGVFLDSGQRMGNSWSLRVALGDVDGDGDLDAFVVNWGGGGGSPDRVWLNDGTGFFVDSGQNLGSQDGTDVSLADLDGDGDLDAFVTNGLGQGCRVWLNNGAGVFIDSGQSLGTSDSYSVDLGDVDGDGDLDAVETNDRQTNRVWLNLGDGTFIDSGQALGDMRSSDVELGDLDGDGDLDAFMANGAGTLASPADRVWLSLGSAPTIASQPQDKIIAYNTSTTLSVTALGTAPLSYQWYQGSSGDTSTPVGIDSSSYTTPNLTASASFWVRVVNSYGSVDSDTVLITVNPPLPEINIRQDTLNIPSGGNYDFGTHDVGSLSDVTFTIENLGILDLILGGSPIITITGADADQFSVQQQPSSPILPGLSSQFTIRFSPSSAGAKTASISIANNDTDENPYDITLTGTGYAAEVNIKKGAANIPDGGSCDFGTHATGNGTNVVFTIENTGTANLNLSGSPIISIIGPDADQFMVLSQPASAVAPAASTFFTIRFFPTSAGIKTAQISIANNDPDENPYDITFNGTGANLVGSLTVTLEPQEARDAGAQWQRLCASTWHDSGYTESSIPAGSETVEFKEIPGWTRPDCKNVTISDGGSTQVTGTYTRVEGGGTFIDSGQAFGNYWGQSVGLGDLDGDSDLDAFVASDGSLNVLLNDGSANFTYSGQSFGSAQNYQAALGDVDNDGDLDALVVKSSYSHNQLWLNDGSGTFVDSGQNLGDSESHGVALGDLDCDGDLDAFIVNANFANPQWSSPNQVWLNDGTGVFFDSGQGLGNSWSLRVALGDVDGDGDLDAFEVNWGGGGGSPDRVWLNDGTGFFVDSGQSLGNHDGRDVSLGDLDRDGDLDAFVANGHGEGCRVWLNNGIGVFTDSGQSLGTSENYSVDLGDVDGDGDLDAFVTSDRQSNRVLLNLGDGTFIDSGQALGDMRSSDVELGDLDGNGDLDAFMANGAGTPASPADRVWLNQVSAPTIASQPQDKVIEYDTSTTLSVTALGTAPLNYQWHQGSTGDTSTPVGIDSSSYTTPNLTASTSFWVRVVNSYGAANSDSAVITVNPPPPVPEMNVKQDSTDIPDGGSHDFGTHDVGSLSDVTFTIESQGTGDIILGGSPIITITGADADQFSVQQQPTSPVSAGFTTTFIIRFSPSSAGAKTASISITNNDADENPYDITLTGTGFCTAPAITEQPQGQEIDYGTSATLNVTATGSTPLGYQWYQGNTGDTSTPVGDNSAQFITPALTETTNFWVRLDNPCGQPVDSETAVITVGAFGESTGPGSQCRMVEQTTDGGYILVGSSDSTGLTRGASDFMALKLDANGVEMWRENFGGPDDERAVSVHQTSDDGYVLAGWSQSFVSGRQDIDEDFYAVRLNVLGVEKRSANFGGTNHDRCVSAVQTLDGGYILAGTTESFTNGGTDILVYKLNALGKREWRRNYGGVNNDGACCVRQTFDGNYIIGGTTESFTNGQSDFLLYKIDAGGYEIWHKNYGSAGREILNSAAQTPDGGYVLLGYTDYSTRGGFDFLAYRLDANGNEIIHKNFGGSSNDWGFSVQPTSDGGYVFAGTSESFTNGGYDFLVYKLNSKGKLQWKKNVGGSEDDYAFYIQQTADGGYVVVGTTHSFVHTPGESDFLIYKLAANGSEEWHYNFGN